MKGWSLQLSTPAHSSTAKRTSVGVDYPLMGESTGDENSNLYIRGVNEGRSGELLEASDLLDILEVFGEDGIRSYLMGVVEGQEDAAEDEQDGEDQE
jgi:hypothetical protein